LLSATPEAQLRVNAELVRHAFFFGQGARSAHTGQVSELSRWVAPDPANPNYLALKLFTNYDGLHHRFATTSVSDTNNGDPNLFSSYAALGSTGKTLMMMVLNKDPANTMHVTFALNGFTPARFTSYTLASTNPTKIVASTSTPWSTATSR